jgi:hypothetical protein
MLKLMRDNQQFIFYEGIDANGVYWTPTPVAESKNFLGGLDKPYNGPICGTCGCEPCECDDEVAEEGRQRPFAKTVSEVQVRPGQEEAVRSNLGAREEDSDFGEFYGQDVDAGYDVAQAGDPDMDDSYEARLSDFQSMSAQQGPGPYGMHGSANNECPECGYTGPDQECPECGGFMAGGEMDIPGDANEFTPEDADIWADDEMDDESYDAGSPGVNPGGASAYAPGIGDIAQDDLRAYPGRRDVAQPGLRGGDVGSNKYPGLGFEDFPLESKEFTPNGHQALTEFLQSARQIVDHNHGASREAIGEALNMAWIHYAGGMDARRAPTQATQVLRQLSKSFPEFNPIAESDAMDKVSNESGIGTDGDGPDTPDKFLAAKDQPGPEDVEDKGEPLGASQKSTTDGPPTVKGTAKGMNEDISRTVRQNVAKLAKHVRSSIQEGAKSLRGNFAIHFACLVEENSRLNRTEMRDSMAEALADAEEILQYWPAKAVVLEAYFQADGKTVLKHNVPMVDVARREPLRNDQVALFRFKRHAENFANELVAEGIACRVTPHNWGAAVGLLSEEGSKRHNMAKNLRKISSK